MSERILPVKKAICYSGYRDGQSPSGAMPTRAQIEEDLAILHSEGYEYIRMYDPNDHARMVLETIRAKNYPMKCMVGVDNKPEVNSKNCIFGEQNFTAEELQANARRNDEELDKLIALANEFPDVINVVSVGNESHFDIVGHFVPEERLIEHANKLHESVKQPVTYNETIGAWFGVKELGKVVDLISFHSYPYHVGTPIEKAMDEHDDNIKAIREAFPDKEICITELGWTTRTAHTDRPGYACVENQIRYIEEATKWLLKEDMVGYFFEAFDETWKADVPEASECNWGIYGMDRKRKW